MIIGVLREKLVDETRVAVTPAIVKTYVKFGFEVLIESNAGIKSHIKNEDYKSSGGTIVELDKLLNKSNIILSVNIPCEKEIGNIKEGTLLVSFMQTTKEIETVKLLQNK